MHELRPENARNAHEHSKRLFLRLTFACSTFICLALALLWLVPAVGFEAVHPGLPLASGIFTAVLIVLVLLAAAGFAVHIRTGRSFPGSSLFRKAAVRFFLPLMELTGRLFGASPESVRHSFIAINNDMVKNAVHPVPAGRILILLPHCLQRAACDLRLYHNPDLCRRCGLCPMGALLDLRDRYGTHLAVATGGTLARRIVKQTRPRVILAVACERDLSSGIQDTYPIPVFGVLNDRPNGPCFDTLVALEKVEEALRAFVAPGGRGEGRDAGGVPEHRQGAARPPGLPGGD